MQLTPNIMPVTKARGQLGSLANGVAGEDYIVLTKGGVPQAALVDIGYLTKLQKDVAKIYRRTFVDPGLVKYTREFTQKEIGEWQEEDQL